MDRERLRELLNKEKAELETRVEKISRDVSSRKISKQFDEQSVERENDQVLVSLDLEAKQELKAIEVALSRIDTDHFNLCAKCGETISDARLEAIPHAIACRNCAE
jgi:RNA polymerase-binding transcription factor DksA